MESYSDELGNDFGFMVQYVFGRLVFFNFPETEKQNSVNQSITIACIVLKSNETFDDDQNNGKIYKSTIILCTLDILFSSNCNIHKSL